MSLKIKVENLILAYDYYTVGLKVSLSPELKVLKLKQDTIQKYSPNLLNRLSTVSLNLSLNRFKTKNPDSTEDDFRRNYLATIDGHKEYKDCLEEVAQKIKEFPSVEELQQFQNIAELL
jgi:hypothetical protein